jgi:hypothetical protein
MLHEKGSDGRGLFIILPRKHAGEYAGEPESGLVVMAHAKSLWLATSDQEHAHGVTSPNLARVFLPQTTQLASLGGVAEANDTPPTLARTHLPLTHAGDGTSYSTFQLLC